MSDKKINGEQNRITTDKNQKPTKNMVETSNTLKKMISMDFLPFSLSVLSILFTFLFNLAFILSLPNWLVVVAYFMSFGFAISAIVIALVNLSSKNKISFAPSLLVSLVAILAVII